MQASTAVGFMLAGLALASRAIRFRRIAAAVVVALGGLTIFSFLFDLPVLAAVLPFSGVGAEVLRPQRFAPATAVAFCFVGAGLVLMSGRRVTTTIPAATLTVLAYGAIGLGAFDLLGSVATGLELWSPSGRQMAAHAAVGFVVLGGALALVANRLSKAGESTSVRRAVAAGTLALFITLIAAQAIRISQITAVQRSTRGAMHSLVREMESAPSHSIAAGGHGPEALKVWLAEAAPGHAIEIGSPSGDTLRAGVPDPRADVVFVERAEVPIYGIAATLSIWPGRAILDDYRRPLGLAVLVFGSTLAVLLTVALQSAATAKARAARLEEAMRSLARSEARLHESRKMEAVARLAGGIAHEFNNLLSVIRGYSQLLEGEDDDASRRSYVGEIELASSRGSDLTRRLLTVSARHVLNPEHISIRTFLNTRADTLRRMLGEHVALRLSALGEDDQLAATVDPEQLEQSLFTLAANARDAMPDGGTFMVRATPRTLDPDTADAIGVRAGRYTEIELADDGVGIDSDRIRSIFEPFRASSKRGPGAGLGLAMLYGFVRQSGGAVEVRSKVGRGTVFRLLLPHGGDTRAKTKLAESAVRRDGANLVLIAEDEDAVRTLVHRILARAGYEVISAVNGREALARAAGREDEVDLLLTDVVMPEMDGSELACTLRERQPLLPILYMSGYADTEIPTGPEPSDGPTSFLQKPFGPALLLARVESLLATPAASNGKDEIEPVRVAAPV